MPVNLQNDPIWNQLDEHLLKVGHSQGKVTVTHARECDLGVPQGKVTVTSMRECDLSVPQGVRHACS